MATRDVSRYVEHLPAAFQDSAFLGRFLLAFERILTGLPRNDAADLPPVPPGIEQILDRIESFFDPATAPPDFLPWLAGWVATSLREDWDEATRRRFLINLIPLYRRRGTRQALQKLLQLYLNPTADPARDAAQDVQIDEPDAPPRYFLVSFTVVERDPAVLARTAAIAIDIIDREKPAHTFYGLRISYPSLQIADPPSYDADHKPTSGVFINVNTVLGGNVLKTK